MDVVIMCNATTIRYFLSFLLLFLAAPVLAKQVVKPLAGTAQVVSHAASSDIQTIIDRGYLVVAMPSSDSPPFFFVRNGELMGLDVDLAKRLSAALNVSLRFNRDARTFNDAVDMVVQRKADIALCKLSRTMARAQVVRFSDSYLVLRHGLAINRVRFAELAKGKDISKIIRNYSGSMAVLEGSSFLNYARKNFPKAQVIEYKDWNEVVAAVKVGKVAAAYRDEFEVKRLLKTDPTISLNIRTVTLNDTQDSLGIAVRPERQHLLAFINLFLSTQTEKLTVDQILNERADWL